MPLLSLPVELQDRIIGYISPSDKLAVAATCTDIFEVAIRLLYLYVELDDHNAQSFGRRMVTDGYHGPAFSYCAYVRLLTIRSFSQRAMSMAAPYLCRAMRHMVALRSLRVMLNGTTADILYMFMCRANFVNRISPTPIITLRPYNRRSPIAFPRLRCLSVGGSLLFFKLAEGRNLEEIHLYSITNFHCEAFKFAMKYIHEGPGPYQSLRFLCIPLYIREGDDIVKVFQLLEVSCPELVDLDIRVCQPGENFLLMRAANDLPSWTKSLPSLKLESFVMRGSLQSLVPYVADPNDGDLAVSSSVHLLFQNLRCLKLLYLGSCKWALINGSWVFSRIENSVPQLKHKRYRQWMYNEPQKYVMSLKESPSAHPFTSLQAAWFEVEMNWERESLGRHGAYRALVLD